MITREVDVSPVGENLAGQDEAFDKLVVANVREMMRDIEDARNLKSSDFYPDSFYKRWKDADKLFRVVRNLITEKYKGFSQIQSVAPHEAIMTLAGDQHQSVFPPNGKFFELRGRTGQRDDDLARRQEKILQVLFDEARYQREMRKVSRDRVMYGTGIFKMHWEREEARKKFKEIIEREVTDELSGEAVLEQVITVAERDVVLREGLKVRHIPLEDFYIEPHATDIAAFNKVERMEMTAEALEGWRKKMKLVRLDKIFKEKADRLWERTDERRMEKQSESGLGTDTKYSSAAAKDNTYTVWECWLHLDLPGEGTSQQDREEGAVTGKKSIVKAWISNQELLYLAKIPYWNVDNVYFSSQFIGNFDGFYGYGLPDIVKTYFYGATDRLNQSIDNVTLNMLRMKAVWRQGLSSPDQDLAVKPDSWIYTKDDPRKIFMDFTVPDMTGTALQLVEFLEEKAKNAMGAVPSKLGIPGTTAATNFSISHEEANKRLGFIVRDFEDDVVIDPVLVAIEFCRQFFTEQRSIRITDPHGGQETWIDVGEEDFYGFQQIDVKPLGISNKRQKIADVGNIINFLNIAMNIPTANAEKLLIDLATAMELPNPEEIIRKDLGRSASIKKAEQENLFMDIMFIPPEPDDNHETEIAVHEKELLQADENQRVNLKRHMAMHIEFALAQQTAEEAAMTQQAAQVPPESVKREEQLNAARPEFAPNRPMAGTSVQSAIQRIAPQPARDLRNAG